MRSGVQVWLRTVQQEGPSLGKARIKSSRGKSCQIFLAFLDVGRIQ